MKTETQKHETITEGMTPKGQSFRIIAGYNPRTSAVTYRALQWDAFGDIGPIGIPLKLTAPVGQLYFELTRNGFMSPETCKASVNA